MIYPTCVLLTKNMTVAAVLRRLEGFSRESRVVVRRDLGPKSSWYLFETAEIRGRLAGEAAESSLEDVLPWREMKPVPTLQVPEVADVKDFSGLVLDADRLMGFADPSVGQGAAGEKQGPPPAARRQPLDFGFRDESKQEEPFVVVPVLYATDRKGVEDRRIGYSYTSERGDLTFGVAEVSIPDVHEIGKLERPHWWRIELKEDPKRHVILMRVGRLERREFLSSLHTSLRRTAGREALLFVHGYRVSFEEAARRAAQIAYDLSWPGDRMLVPTLYSWPSKGKYLGYLADEANASWTAGHFEEFLRLLLSPETGARNVHVLAHSMGNRPLIETLKRFDKGTLPEGSARLSQVIFAAPDLDADEFRSLARAFARHAGRCTLYASSNDEALRVSREVRYKLPRAGESDSGLVVVAGVDTIDASEADTSLVGHSYYGQRTILHDIFYTLGGKGPDERFGLKARRLGDLRYWELQP